MDLEIRDHATRVTRGTRCPLSAEARDKDDRRVNDFCESAFQFSK